MEAIIKSILRERAEIFKNLGISKDCDWFDSEKLHSLDDLVRVLFHPQGVQFCIENNFPSLGILRHFKHLNVETLNVYIDAGEVKLHNPSRVYLIGETSATITCDKGRSNIMLMHGAKASVVASKWSVAIIQNTEDCEVDIDIKDRAKVF